MALTKAEWDEFRREADALIHRLRVEGQLAALRAILRRLLPIVETMNLGDVADFPLGEDVAEKDALQFLGELGCLTVLHLKRDRTVGVELFSKRRLVYLSEKINGST